MCGACAEDGEIDATVSAMLAEAGMRRKVVVLAVLKDEYPVFFQQPFLQDEVGNRGQFFQGIWRVGKDEVKLLTARLHEAEGISTQGDATFADVQLLQTVADEAVVVAVLLDADNVATSARQQFERDASRAREQVKRRGSLKVHVACQDIKDVFFRKVRRRPCLECAGDVKMPSLIASCDDSHLPFVKSAIRS